MPEDTQAIIQFLLEKFAGRPEVQAPPRPNEGTDGRYTGPLIIDRPGPQGVGQLRRPQRGRGGPRNTENAPSVMGPQGQRGTTRRTRGMIDHSKQLSDIPGEGIQGFLEMLQANPQDPRNRINRRR